MRHRYRRSRQPVWWKRLTSPKLLLIAAPLLLVPVGVILFRGAPATVSPVDLAIGALPVSPVSGTQAAPAALGGGMPSALGLSLYADSAQSPQTRLAVRGPPAQTGWTQDPAVVDFAVLHPQQAAGFLSDQLGLIYQTPSTLPAR
ncbi:MAG: hypothetical protein KGJ41_08455 [Rhodospirillales bacterium]|nr:hypothetical protein [Rhodospirillales bacterium]MDE2199040.1 hypothetical protein [Rhodospirillales bacterium]MDE2575915.1 hypothetical protein [Rhodospirillales bacterium]